MLLEDMPAALLLAVAALLLSVAALLLAVTALLLSVAALLLAVTALLLSVAALLLPVTVLLLAVTALLLSVTALLLLVAPLLLSVAALLLAVTAPLLSVAALLLLVAPLLLTPTTPLSLLLASLPDDPGVTALEACVPLLATASEDAPPIWELLTSSEELPDAPPDEPDPVSEEEESTPPLEAETALDAPWLEERPEDALLLLPREDEVPAVPEEDEEVVSSGVLVVRQAELPITTDNSNIGRKRMASSTDGSPTVTPNRRRAVDRAEPFRKAPRGARVRLRAGIRLSGRTARGMKKCLVFQQGGVRACAWRGRAR